MSFPIILNTCQKTVDEGLGLYLLLEGETGLRWHCHIVLLAQQANHSVRNMNLPARAKC